MLLASSCACSSWSGVHLLAREDRPQDLNGPCSAGLERRILWAVPPDSGDREGVDQRRPRGISRPRGPDHARPECECARLLAGPAEHGVILRASVDGADQLYDRALLIIPVGRYGYAARGAGPDARGIRGQVLRWPAGTLPTAVLSAGAVPARLWPGAWLGRGVLRGRVGGAAAAAVAANGDWRAAGDGGGASHSCPPRARNRRRARRHGRHQLVHLQPVLEPDHATRRERALAGLPAPVRQP